MAGLGEETICLTVVKVQLVLERVEVVVAIGAIMVHHQLVAPLIGEVALCADWLVLLVFGFLRSVFKLFGLASLSSVHVSEELNFLEFEDMDECHGSHLGIVSCLMVVRKQPSAVVIGEAILDIKLALDVVNELGVIRAFLIDIAKACLEEDL